MWVLLSAEHDELGRKAFVRTARGMLSPESPLLRPLLREAELLAKLSHPNVLVFHELVHGESELAVVLEHGEGPLLSARLAKGRLDPDTAADVMRAVLAGLAHAHERDVVHGGLAARHVVLSPDGAKVFGFGMSSGPLPLDAGDDDTADPPAPEVLLGERPTKESDVFAAGALAFRVFSGEGAFDAPRDVPERRPQLAEARRLEMVVPGVPPALARLVARCLAESPEDRFASAGEVLAEWDRILGPKDRAARKDTPLLGVAERPSEVRPRELSMWVTLGGQLFVLFALVLGLSLLHARSPDGELVEQPGSLDLVPERAGYLRVLARPWAHVYVDGVQVETTPFARPIPLREGLHDVVLKHPASTDVKRHVRIGKGETAVLEVEMPVPPPPPPPRPSGSAAAKGP